MLLLWSSLVAPASAAFVPARIAFDPAAISRPRHAAALMSDELPRRSVVQSAAAALLASPALLHSPLPAFADAESAIVAELKAVNDALVPVSGLLDEQKWDAVRSILKTPPVGNLWNLGESKNSIRKLAELKDDVEIFELAEDVAGALQLCDQYSYDNTFIYTQPGSGKV